MTKSQSETAKIALLTRRSLLRGAAAGAAGMTVARFGFTPAIAQEPITVTILCADIFKMAESYAATEMPEDDGRWAVPQFLMMQKWKEKYPDVKLNIQEVPFSGITQRVILDSQSGNQADLCYINDLNIPKLAGGGFLKPLDDFDGHWDEYNQYLLRGIASSGGKIYGMPTVTDCRHEMYWKVDFEKAGIKEPASTWAEFADQLSALKDAGIESPYAHWSGNSVHTPTQSVFSQLWMLGGNVIGEDLRATLNTPEMHKVFEFYNDLHNVRKVVRSDIVSISSDDEYGALIRQHKVSAIKSGSWLWSQLTKDGVQDQLGVFRTPRPTADAPDATLSGFWAFEMPDRPDRNPDVEKMAFEFANFYTSVEGQTLIIDKKAGQLPTRTPVLDAPEAKSKDDIWQFQAKYAAEAGRGMPPASDSGLLFDQLRIAFQTYITGAASAEAALKAAETAYNTQIG
jgi:ABC-type glycerol-3-phosphate transport system substrate-binding protein